MASPDTPHAAAMRTAEIAKVVADHWRRAALGWGDLMFPGRATAHPLFCVLAALDGETDPRHLGIEEGPDADLIRRLAEVP